MSLSPGTRLGPYEVTAAIGAGGMGEVYRATDINLGRQVAIKVLPEAVAQDAERLARFDREARTLAALNHPNIAQIYGIERSNGLTALVMELVEGEDLSNVILAAGRGLPAAGPSESVSRGATASGGGAPRGQAEAERVSASAEAHGPRLARGGGAPRGLSLDDALAIARQIADALEAAHEQGIIHRDLKPANIKVREDGTVKVLDFGLAKAMEPAGAMSASASMSPTITTPAMTQMGMILGTAAYMAPEQARGKAVDRRADIWAFGCVLYEMLTGQRAFDGEDMTDVLASVVKDQPDLSAVPARFRKLVDACLQKDPRKRLQSIGDARLLWADDVAAPPALRPTSRLPWVAAATLAAGLALALWAPWRASVSSGTQDMSVALASSRLVWLSPDGTRLLELGASNRVLTLSTGQYQELPGTEGMRAPFWSPDGRWIAFYTNIEKLMITPSSGGPVQEICSAGSWFGGAWHPNGTVLLTTSNGPIQAVTIVNGAASGDCAPVLGATEDSQWSPEWLPDGEHFLYTVPNEGSVAPGVYFAALHDPAPRRILPDASSVRYAPPVDDETTGHLLFRRGSRLMAQPFRAEDGSLDGDPVELASGVLSYFTPSYSTASIASNGLLAYSTGVTQSELTWFDRQGREVGKVGMPQDYRAVSLSPDDTVVGASFVDTNSTTTRVTDGVETRFATSFSTLVWSPDRAWIAAAVENQGLVRFPSAGGAPEVLVPSRTRLQPSQWSDVGLFYSDMDDVWYLPQPGTPGSQPVRVLGTPADESGAQLSPDGRWLAYVEVAPAEAVYVCRFPDCTDRQRLAGIREPRWSADGKELFWYRRAANGLELMAATVQTGTTFTYDPPRVLFSASPSTMSSALNLYSYAASRDGQRFLVNVSESSGRVPHLVTNWRRLLRKPEDR